MATRKTKSEVVEEIYQLMVKNFEADQIQTSEQRRDEYENAMKLAEENGYIGGCFEQLWEKATDKLERYLSQW